MKSLAFDMLTLGVVRLQWAPTNHILLSSCRWGHIVTVSGSNSNSRKSLDKPRVLVFCNKPQLITFDWVILWPSHVLQRVIFQAVLLRSTGMNRFYYRGKILLWISFVGNDTPSSPYNPDPTCRPWGNVFIFGNFHILVAEISSNSKNVFWDLHQTLHGKVLFRVRVTCHNLLNTQLAVILFSATFSPFSIYPDLKGLTKSGEKLFVLWDTGPTYGKQKWQLLLRFGIYTDAPRN